MYDSWSNEIAMSESGRTCASAIFFFCCGKPESQLAAITFHPQGDERQSLQQQKNNSPHVRFGIFMTQRSAQSMCSKRDKSTNATDSLEFCFPTKQSRMGKCGEETETRVYFCRTSIKVFDWLLSLAFTHFHIYKIVWNAPSDAPVCGCAWSSSSRTQWK